MFGRRCCSSVAAVDLMSNAYFQVSVRDTRSTRDYTKYGLMIDYVFSFLM